MKIIEILIDAIYFCLLILLMPFIVYKVIKYEKYRKHFWERFGKIKPRKDLLTKPCIWIHAVSVGETIAAEPLISELRKTYPEHEIVLSVTTKTGREVALKKFPDIYSFQYPTDLSYIDARVFRRIRPNIVILMELEVWPNFMIQAARRKIPVIVANGRLSANSFKGYFRMRGFIGFMFRKVSLALAQSDEYADRFRKMGVPQVETVGTMKYDNVNISASDELREIYRKVLKLADDEKLIVAGSTHPPEHLVVARAHRKLLEKGFKIRLVLVPRHPEKYERVKNELKNENFEYELRSETPESAGDSSKIFFVDTMGELAGIYSVGNIAFIGGSLIPHGGQNMIEPAGLGVIPVLGKNYWNFQLPADDLLAANASVLMEKTVAIEDAPNAQSIEDTAVELSEICANLLADEGKLNKMRENALAVVEKGKGAAQRSVKLLKTFLSH